MFLVPLILFIFSSLGIIALVGVKTYQLSRGVQLPLAAKRTFVETKIKTIERGVKHKTATIKGFFCSAGMWKAVQSVDGFARRVSRAIKNALTVPGHWLDRNTRNLVSLVRGRQSLTERREPSSFMRDISRQ